MNSNPRRFHAFAAVLALLLLSPQAGAQPRERGATGRPEGPPREIASKVLPNGLHVLVWPDHDISNVSLYTYYHVGSRNERPGITGLSHFFEHMMFNGSARFRRASSTASWRRTAARTTRTPRTTSRCTRTGFRAPRSRPSSSSRPTASAASRSTPPSWRASGASCRPSGRRVDDDNASLLDEQVMATAYVAHPYQIPVIGWPSDIQHWSMSDLKSYFRTYYAPNNATMVVAGDVTPEEIFRLAEKHFGPIPGSQPPSRVGPRAASDGGATPRGPKDRAGAAPGSGLPCRNAARSRFEASTSCTSFSRRGMSEALPAAGRPGAQSWA